MRTPPVSFAEMVDDPVKGALRILANQIEDRNEFIRKKGLWKEFEVWLSGLPAIYITEPNRRREEMTETTPQEYFKTTAYDYARASYATRDGAERAQRVQPHPHNWYVCEMSDGSWHISLMTNREA